MERTKSTKCYIYANKTVEKIHYHRIGVIATCWHSAFATVVTTISLWNGHHYLQKTSSHFLHCLFKYSLACTLHWEVVPIKM